MDFAVGQRVGHPDYGPGTVLNVNGSTGQRIVTIDFDSVGPKQLANDHEVPDPEELAHLKAAMRVLDRNELDNLPPVQPLIGGTLDRRTLALLAGYWGTGKTFIALDWALSASTLRPWQARHVFDRQGNPVERVGGAEPYRALYVAAEGAYGISQRVNAWEHAWHRKAEHFQVMPQALNLLARGDIEKLVRYVEMSRTDIVVIDTLSRCMPGADENSAKDMSSAIVALDRIKAATDGGMVLAVHHTGKDKTTVRGSSVLEGACDTVYQVEGDPSFMKLTRTKRKDGPTFDQLNLCLENTLDSCVIGDVRGQDQLPSWDKLFRVFADNFADTGASKAELRAVAEMPPASFARALNALVGARRIVNTGADSRPFYRLEKEGDGDVR